MTDAREPHPSGYPEAEVVVARFRPHGRRLVWPAVLVVIACAGAGFGIGIFQGELAWLNGAVAVVAVVLVVAGGLVPFLRWLGQRCVVTTRRLVLVRGLLVRTRQELLHSRGYDVTLRRAGLQTLFRSGDVIVQSGMDRPMVLPDVPSADLVLTVLHDLMEAAMVGQSRADGAAGTPPTDAAPSAPIAGSFWIDRD